ncbi:hypothetical protein [Aliivibrio fischeri]|uniref:hypothetical protein n=1 Tax=Aliivibrio fischeri TaxID=668 RepID=UPI00080E864C|nr:hypothetical protein [Aliivibrio fischeri]OCH41788.1 hypothetical protein A6D99_18940 [Aliivibrio fischeri]
MNTCKYCGDNEAIENSHIIPSFICRWVKETSPTNVLRSSINPNVRQQDGEKEPLLCKQCEGEFSTYERAFKKVFSQMANYRKDFPNEIKFTKETLSCITSIAWRVLAGQYYFPKDHLYTRDEVDRFPEFLDKMKEQISSGVQNYTVHFIPCTKEVIKKVGLPQIDFSYYERSFGAEPRIWDDWARFIIYIKIPFGIFVVELVKNNHDIWTGTKLSYENPFLIVNVEKVPPVIGYQVSHFFGEFLKSLSKLTEKQKELMRKDINNFKGDCGSFKTNRKKWD